MTAEELANAGFSLFAPTETAKVLPATSLFGRALADCARVMVVANTVSLWPKFVEAYQASPALQAADEPLDAWVEKTIGLIARDRPVFYAHRRYANAGAKLTSWHMSDPQATGEYVPIQDIAVAAKLGRLAKTHLVIHPIAGPWISLRAVIGLRSGEGYFGSVATGPPASECTPACEAGFDALRSRTDATWRDWYELRASCSIAEDKWRFSDEQILYHYTKDRSVIGSGATLPPR